MTLKEYLAFKQANQTPKDHVITVPVERLQNLVRNFNKNLSACGVEIMSRDGEKWDSIAPTKELAIPAGLNSVDRLARLEAFAKAKKQELGALQYDII